MKAVSKGASCDIAATYLSESTLEYRGEIKNSGVLSFMSITCKATSVRSRDDPILYQKSVFF